MKKVVCGIEISSGDKILYPKDNVCKYDVAVYYDKIADRMLPFVENRLLSVIRCHDSIKGECFFKKHPNTEGEMVSTYMFEDEEYFYVKTKKELVFQAQMGTLEFHTWGSKIKNVDRPDIMVFDLDPNEDVSLDRLRDGVKNLKSVLDELSLKSFLKTSGGKGFHIVVPFSSTKDWVGFSDFSKQVALLVEARWPKLYTTNIRKDQRKGKIFVDYLRNKKQSTCVAPYSLRARDGAGISFPISWSDLDKTAPNEITIKNVFDQMSKQDPWAEFYNIKQVLK